MALNLMKVAISWLGLVLKQYSTGGKPRLGRITKHGDQYLRTLLVHGARTVIANLGDKQDKSVVAKRSRAERNEPSDSGTCREERTNYMVTFTQSNRI
ncbi:conserved hypothetical protein [Vibrio chagasii]|nr:conserved hypothetical protein [Vibrio chagasii]